MNLEQCLLLLLFRRQAVCKLINRNLRMAQPKPPHIFAQIDCYFDSLEGGILQVNVLKLKETMEQIHMKEEMCMEIIRNVENMEKNRKRRADRWKKTGMAAAVFARRLFLSPDSLRHNTGK